MMFPPEVHPTHMELASISSKTCRLSNVFFFSHGPHQKYINSFLQLTLFFATFEELLGPFPKGFPGGKRMMCFGDSFTIFSKSQKVLSATEKNGGKW